MVDEATTTQETEEGGRGKKKKSVSKKDGLLRATENENYCPLHLSLLQLRFPSPTSHRMRKVVNLKFHPRHASKKNISFL